MSSNRGHPDYIQTVIETMFTNEHNGLYKGNVSVPVILTKLSLESLEHPSSVILSLR